MGIPHITSFCWCMGLEMGSKVIGMVHLAIAITLIILCSVYADNARGYIDTIEDGDDHLYKTVYKICVTVAVTTIVHVVLAATLLYSAYRRATFGLRVWVWVMLSLSVCALVFIFVQICLHGLSGSGSDMFISFFEGLLFFSILAYCILCVNSYYLMLKSSEDMEGPKPYY